MTYLSEDESNLDWLNALQNDADQFALIINRVEALSYIAEEKLKRHDLGAVLIKLSEMREGIKLCKTLTGVK
jgi:hypothetical protein